MSAEGYQSTSVESILNEVHDDIAPSATISKMVAAKSIVSKLVSTSKESPSPLITEMKNADALFNSIFDSVFFAGLFYDGICDVADSKNFKLYFLLNLPFDKALTLSDSSSDVSEILGIPPGYVSLWSKESSASLLPTSHARYVDCQSISDCFDYVYTGYFWRTYYYIIGSSRVNHWFEYVLAKAVENIVIKYNSFFSRWFYYPENLFYDIGVEGLGPVNLNIVRNFESEVYLELREENGFSVSIQMLPVFKFQDKFLIPKPQQTNANLWRLSDIQSEKKLIHGKVCVEKVIRLLIKFCEMQGENWSEMTDYRIKTLVLLHLQNNPWLTKDVGLLFMGSLRDLLECFARRRISYYFNNDYNLLANLDVFTIEEMKVRLERILKDVHQNDTITLRKYFTVKECNTQTIDGSDPKSYCSLM